jgi:ABC-type transport system involved in multi-copper enzyme maturation permease subunit
MRMWALVTDSLREIYARKVIIGVVIIELVTLTITALILFSDAMQRDYQDARLATADTAAVEAPQRIEDPATFDSDDSLLLGIDSAASALDSSARSDTTRSRSLEEGTLPASPTPGSPTPGPSGDVVVVEQVKGQLGSFAIPTLLATLFLGIFATAGIVPSMMEKGTIDLLLSKPLPRWQLLWGRAAGGAVAVGANLLLFSTAIWALYGIASGVWYTPFIGLTFLFGFATFLILFTAIIALNVSTESWVLPMSLAYIHLVLLSNFLTNRDETIFRWVEAPFLQTLISGLYYALPQTNDVIVQIGPSVLTGSVLDWSPFVQGGLFALAMIGIATWRFQRKDF